MKILASGDEMENQMCKVIFEEVKPIFEYYRYWSKEEEVFWYENMWQILERKGLTAYKNDEEHCEIILMAVAMVIMFTDHIALKYDEVDLHDYFYSNVVSDMISEFNLGAMYYKYTKEFDDGSENYNDVVEFLANIMKDKVYGALVKDLGVTTLFLSMEAVDRGMEHMVMIKDENESYVEEEFEPKSAKEFWEVFKEREEDIADEIDLFDLDIGSMMYGWVESGCPSVL